VGAAVFPLPDDVIALGNEIRRAPEIEIRKCCTEIGGELLDRGAAPQRLMQRVLKTDVRGGQLVDDIRVPWAR
jgi:hypothetical protein